MNESLMGNKEDNEIKILTSPEYEELFKINGTSNSE